MTDQDSATTFTLTDREAESLTGGRWHSGISDIRSVQLTGAAIDSRKVAAGQVFVCIPGEKADGHNFAASAVESGASLIIASRELDVAAPVLVVDDVVAAFADLARAYRQAYQGAVWIGITGSNGKTTVKELLRTACGALGPVSATHGNLNNHLGVPLTVLNTPPGQAAVIVEMGASAVGEIAHLASIAQPDLGVITSLGPAHLEGFGSLLGVATGKSELFSAVADGGRMLLGRHGLSETCATYGVDVAELLAIVRTAAAHGNLTVVGEAGCPVDGSCNERSCVLRTPVGEVGLRLVGEHNLANAALAWHTAVAAGADPDAALGYLATVPPASGRLDVHEIGKHRLLDDAYNANPASMQAGLQVLARQPGARLAVLGAMSELGDSSVEQHHAIGATVAKLGLPLITVGKLGVAIGAGYTKAGGRDLEHAATTEDAIDEVLNRLKLAPHAVLIKASRSAGLDRIAIGILDRLGYAGGPTTAIYRKMPC